MAPCSPLCPAWPRRRCSNPRPAAARSNGGCTPTSRWTAMCPYAWMSRAMAAEIATSAPCSNAPSKRIAFMPWTAVSQSSPCSIGSWPGGRRHRRGGASLGGLHSFRRLPHRHQPIDRGLLPLLSVNQCVVLGGDQLGLLDQLRQLVAGFLVAVHVPLQFGIEIPLAKYAGQRFIDIRRDANQSLRKLRDLFQRGGAFAFLGAQFHARDQPAKVPIALAIFA